MPARQKIPETPSDARVAQSWLWAICHRLCRAGRAKRGRRGSVLVIVMITLLFATFALLAFMEKASVDLLVDQRQAVTRRLRVEAYSALETTLAVLEEFRQVGNGLRSPSEGWGTPLEFAEYTPAEGRTVEVTFEDESGKISLPRATAPVLTQLFMNWGILQVEAEALADAMLGWMKHDHVYSSTVEPNYETGPIPFEPPGRSLRSFHELAAIEKVRETFYDSHGRPNEYWKRFVESVSLLNFEKSNLNGAGADTLAALGQFDPQQQQNIGDYLNGTGMYQNNGPRFFQDPSEVQQIAGPAGAVSSLGATISALRIVITVHDGTTQFRMSAVVAPPNGATAVQETATSTRKETSTRDAKSASKQQARPDAKQSKKPATAKAGVKGDAAQSNLKYPFTLLEIRENDATPQMTGTSETSE